MPVTGDCQHCHEEPINTQPLRMCKSCGKYLCRYCVLVDKNGDTFCPNHKSDAAV